MAREKRNANFVINTESYLDSATPGVDRSIVASEASGDFDLFAIAETIAPTSPAVGAIFN
jgi:hypothetical protein